LLSQFTLDLPWYTLHTKSRASKKLFVRQHVQSFLLVSSPDLVSSKLVPSNFSNMLPNIHVNIYDSLMFFNHILSHCNIFTCAGEPASTVGWRDPGFIHTAFLKNLSPDKE
jgi:hypothetical protein